MRVLVTGAAGFIGRAVCDRLLASGSVRVLGVDNLNNYYDPKLKAARIATLDTHVNFDVRYLDVAHDARIAEIVRAFRPDGVVHLAAQAGVRDSLEHPFLYTRANVDGFVSVLEAVRRYCPAVPVVYASSSSVYGERGGRPDPLDEDLPLRTPASLYAATKQAGEIIAGTYASLYGLKLTGLRFFTVYGPWGRPDMATWTFADAILSGRRLLLNNGGEMARDLTHVDDAAQAVTRLLHTPPPMGENRIVNVGRGKPVSLVHMVSSIESALKLAGIYETRPMQPGDVTATWADTTKLKSMCGGWAPEIDFAEGVSSFTDWFKQWRAR